MHPLLWPAAVYALILLLHLIVPARWVDGYVRDAVTGRPLRYRLNGLRVLALVVVGWALLCRLGRLGWDAFYVHRWEMLAGAFLVGMAFSLAIVLPAPKRSDDGFLMDLYAGRLDNPQWGGGRIDAKMYLYLAGAILLELNILSFTAHHVLAYGQDPNPGVFVYAALFTFFVVDYVTFEEVHLYTYDFMAERVGFKLGWGCLVFYPFFYCIGLWAVAGKPNPHVPSLWFVLAVVMFFGGWILSRGANMQKFYFKRDPHARAFGFLDPRPITDGERYVLAGGFWGLSRHVNYLGEILMATGLTLGLGYPTEPLPWLYPLYYVALLVPRQAADDKRCAKRYGELWEEYCKRVPWRIVPYLY